MKSSLRGSAVVLAVGFAAFAWPTTAAAQAGTPKMMAMAPEACGTVMPPRAAPAAGAAARPALTAEQRAPRAATAASPDRWEPDISKFEAQDKTAPPPQDGIVFVGSSSIVYWNLPGCFPQLGAKAIKRGFGGSLIGDSVRYADRIVIPYKPRIVVLYAGDNDLTTKATGQEIAEQFTLFEKKVHAALPATRIIWIAIKPSIQRIAEVDKLTVANGIIREYCAKNPTLTYLDIVPLMLGEDGKPRADLLVQDGLHMTSDGYKLWTAAITPLLK